MLDVNVLRDASRELDDISSDLELRVYRNLKETEENTMNSLEGAAADAISEKTAVIKQRCKSLADKIEDVSVLLKQFASQLEEADNEASVMISKV